ncbi:rRNA adenine N-6-methyltransferase family protein [Streptomyces sp. NPDC101455]|uniref:rRNA adenine N-6-methyltransferase family protein n=1 Tax=Streptomyces sp. NPDC101455 TaxID=3366142 RepID=UPI0038076CD1
MPHPNPATAEYVARPAVPQGHHVPLLLEVGARKGALTAKLAPHCRELHAHEIDPRLVPKLRTRFSTTPQVHVVFGRVDRRPTPLLDPAALRDWRHLVELGFSGVGGSPHASLCRAHPGRRVDAAFRAAGLDPRVLVGEVSPEHWLRLHAALKMS